MKINKNMTIKYVIEYGTIVNTGTAIFFHTFTY